MMTKAKHEPNNSCGDVKSPSGSQNFLMSVSFMHSISRPVNSLNMKAWYPYLKIETSLIGKRNHGMFAWSTKKPVKRNWGTTRRGTMAEATCGLLIAVPRTYPKAPNAL